MYADGVPAGCTLPIPVHEYVQGVALCCMFSHVLKIDSGLGSASNYEGTRLHQCTDTWRAVYM